MLENYHDSKVYGANMGPIWGQQDPGEPHAGPMNFAIWVELKSKLIRNGQRDKFLQLIAPEFVKINTSGASNDGDIRPLTPFSFQSVKV